MDTRFYVLKEEGTGSPYETEFEEVDPPLGDWLTCPACGGYVGGKERLPSALPFRAEITFYGKEFGDLAWYVGSFLLSERLAGAIQEAGLTGLSGFAPVEVVRTKRARKKTPPDYVYVTVARSRAAVDEDRSLIRRPKPITCNECRAVGVDGVWGFCLEEGSWSGEDVFFARGMPGSVIVTERFRRLVEDGGFTNARFTPIEEYVWDPYAPRESAAEEEQDSSAATESGLDEPPSSMEIVGLHRLPFDKAAFSRDVSNAGAKTPEEEAEWAAQFRENWDNAWLVVVASKEPGQTTDVHKFEYGAAPGDPDNQVPWMDTELGSLSDETRVGFYLHYVDPEQGLWYGDYHLDFPPVTAAPVELLKQMPYESPD